MAAIFGYTAFLRIVGIERFTAWYLALHIVTFVLAAGGYYLSASYKWFYLFAIMIAARAAGFIEAGEDLLLSYAVLGEFNLVQCALLIAMNYQVAWAMVPACLLILYDNYVYREYIATPYVRGDSELAAASSKRELYLAHMLPKNILTQYLTNPSYSINYEETFGNATILYADLAGFMAYKATTTANCAAEILRVIYNRFDTECVKSGLYRVRIVGDKYTVFSVNEATIRNPRKEVRDTVEFAFKILQIVEEVC